MTDDQIDAVRAHVARYAGADDRRALAVLAATVAAQAGVFWLYAAGWGPLAMLLGAGVAVRSFIIYHDAIHRSFFRSRVWNERLATVLQVWTLTPVPLWRRNHLAHHRRFGDLGFHDIADTILFTRAEYDAMPAWKRRLWRIGRSPLPFFTLLPLVQWLGEYPLLAGNVWIWSGLALHAGLIWEVSAWHAGAMYLGMVTGLILFHLQHGINRGYRETTERWDFARAALLGSTWVRVPRPLRWFTLGIEFHHVHHLHPGVPCYATGRCHREAPPGAWDEVTVGRWRNCLASMRNVMWDDEKKALTPF